MIFFDKHPNNCCVYVSLVIENICVRVVLISGLVSGMAAMAFYWGGRLAWVSEMISFAYIAIACVFLVVPWLRRMSMDQVVRYLEKQSVPNIDAQNRQGNLKQLMRTYHYYHKTTTQPALFDWIRRQLRLHMLGKDPPERDGGMGVMTDQDNTQKGSEGDYDDFVLERREAPRHARVIEFSRCGQ